MFHINIKRNLLVICQMLVCYFLSAQTADITTVTEPTTNSSGNNGKMTITIDPASTTSPYTVVVSGPSGYSYSTTTSSTSIVLTPLSYGDYTGKIVGNNNCVAPIAARVKKCKTVPVIGGGTTITCEEVAEPDPRDDKKFFATGYTSNQSSSPVINYTFQVFHGMPSYLYDQLAPGFQQTMISQINTLRATDYSAFEVFEQYEFPSEAPYIFSFNADGSLIWVYRNQSRDEGSGRSRENPEQGTGRIYPNPTSGLVYVPVGKKADARKLSFTVINSIGKVVLSNTLLMAGEAENFVVDMKELPAGVYFIRVADAETEQHVFTVLKI